MKGTNDVKAAKTEKEEYKKRKKEQKQQKKEEKAKKKQNKLEKHGKKHKDSLQNNASSGKNEEKEKEKKLPKIKKKKKKEKLKETADVETSTTSAQLPEISVTHHQQDIQTAKKKGKIKKLFRKKDGKPNESATPSISSQGLTLNRDLAHDVKLNRGLSVSCDCVLEVHKDSNKNRKTKTAFIKKRAKKLRNAVSVMSLTDPNPSKSVEKRLNADTDLKSVASSTGGAAYDSCSTTNSFGSVGDSSKQHKKKKKKLAHKIHKTMLGKKGADQSDVITEPVVECDQAVPQLVGNIEKENPVIHKSDGDVSLYPEQSNPVDHGSNEHPEMKSGSSRHNSIGADDDGEEDMKRRSSSPERKRAVTRKSSVLVSSKKRLKKKRHKALGGMLRRMKNSKTTKTTEDTGGEEDEEEMIRRRRATRTASVYRATSTANPKKVQKEEKAKKKKEKKHKKKKNELGGSADEAVQQRPRGFSKLVMKNEKKKEKRKFLVFRKRSNSRRKAEKKLIKQHRQKNQESALPRKTVEELRAEVEEVTRFAQQNVLNLLEQKEEELNTLVQKSEELGQSSMQFAKNATGIKPDDDDDGDAGESLDLPSRSNRKYLTIGNNWKPRWRLQHQQSTSTSSGCQIEMELGTEMRENVSHQLERKYRCCCFRICWCWCCPMPKRNKMKKKKIKTKGKVKYRTKKNGSVSSRGSKYYDVVPGSCSLSSSNSSLNRPIKTKSNRSSLFFQAIRQNHDLQSSHSLCLSEGEASTSRGGSLKIKFLGSSKEGRNSNKVGDDEEFLSQFGDEKTRESARELLELDRS